MAQGKKLLQKIIRATRPNKVSVLSGHESIMPLLASTFHQRDELRVQASGAAATKCKMSPPYWPHHDPNIACVQQESFVHISPKSFSPKSLNNPQFPRAGIRF